MKKVVLICIIAVLSIITVRDLFSEGMIRFHDTPQLARVFDMTSALRDGQFPVRWVTNLGYGYGYPIFNFYAPLPYYVGALFNLSGLDTLQSTKIMILAGMLLAPIGMFLFVSTISSIENSVLSAILYAFAPYHAVELYVRGAIGELWVYAILPFIFYGIALTYYGKRKGELICILGLFGAIISHTLLGYFTVLFCFLSLIMYFLYSIFFRRSSLLHVKKFGIACIVSLGLAAFFWLPAISEMSYTSVSNQILGSANYVNHFVCIGQLWDSSWGYGGSAPGCIDGMSFRIGKIHIVLAITGLFFLLFGSKNTMHKTVGKLFFLLGIGSIFLMISYSNFLWILIPKMSFLQYPWRLLIYVDLAMSVLAAYSVQYIQSSKLRGLVTIMLIVVSITTYSKLFVSQSRDTRGVSELINANKIKYEDSFISDEYLPPTFQRPATYLEIHSEKFTSNALVTYRIIKSSSIGMEASVLLSRPDELIFYNTHFPGWVYTNNGKPLDIERFSEGIFPVFVLSQGENHFTATFTNTNVRLISNLISLVSIPLLWYYMTHGRSKTIC